MDVEFDKRGCARALRRWPGLEQRIVEAIDTQEQAGWFKCKTATKRPFCGHSLQECRVNERSCGSVRVAFWVEGTHARVVYITPTLVKRDFTRELERFIGEAQS